MAAAILLSDAIDEWVASMKGQGQSTSTVKNYTYALRQFMTLVGNIYVKSVHSGHVDKFFAANPEWKGKTKKLKMSALASFFAWARRRGAMRRDLDPLDGFAKIKTEDVDLLRIPVQRFPEILSLAKHPRNRILVATLLYLLVRDSEARRIQWKDVDLDGGTVWINRKKTRSIDPEVPISVEFDQELRTWKRYLEQHHGIIQPEWYVLCRRPVGYQRDPETGRKLAASEREGVQPTQPLSYLGGHVSDLIKKMGLDDWWGGSHTLRRSGARALYDHLVANGEGNAIRLVQSMLGHKTQQQTEAYIGINHDRVARNNAIKGKSMYGLGSTEGGTVTKIDAWRRNGGQARVRQV